MATLAPAWTANGNGGVAQQAGFSRQPKSAALAAVGRTDQPPKWIKPPLTRLVEEAPSGESWVHEVKYDGYRMHARIDGRDIKLLTRTGLDWSHRYRRTIEALRELKVKSAYLDGDGPSIGARCGRAWASDQGRPSGRHVRVSAVSARIYSWSML